MNSTQSGCRCLSRNLWCNEVVDGGRRGAGGGGAWRCVCKANLTWHMITIFGQVFRRKYGKYHSRESMISLKGVLRCSLEVNLTNFLLEKRGKDAKSERRNQTRALVVTSENQDGWYFSSPSLVRLLVCAAPILHQRAISCSRARSA